MSSWPPTGVRRPALRRRRMLPVVLTSAAFAVLLAASLAGLLLPSW